jgi:hypothetical protein
VACSSNRCIKVRSLLLNLMLSTPSIRSTTTLLPLNLSPISMVLLKLLSQTFPTPQQSTILSRLLPSKPMPMPLLLVSRHLQSRQMVKLQRLFQQFHNRQQPPKNLQPTTKLQRKISPKLPGWSIPITIPVPKRRWPCWPDILSLLNRDRSWLRKPSNRRGRAVNLTIRSTDRHHSHCFILDLSTTYLRLRGEAPFFS